MFAIFLIIFTIYLTFDLIMLAFIPIPGTTTTTPRPNKTMTTCEFFTRTFEAGWFGWGWINYTFLETSCYRYTKCYGVKRTVELKREFYPEIKKVGGVRYYMYLNGKTRARYWGGKTTCFDYDIILEHDEYEEAYVTRIHTTPEPCTYFGITININTIITYMEKP